MVGASQISMLKTLIDGKEQYKDFTQTLKGTNTAYEMMQQNGEQATGQDMFSELISSMFKAALGLVMKIKADEVADKMANNNSQIEANGQTQEDNNVVKRDRETVDVKALQQRASVNFDTECPEQQQSNGQRLA